ncbi:hypothetical protein [Sphingopyxis sp. H081]|uniref:hypothetical protein n=1 Tax=Sphingopyxis sp. H081 TaxID=1759080 RepID=UPI0012E3CFB0|nr:hypothetical protein [Sphingopyxis sp. H081]
MGSSNQRAGAPENTPASAEPLPWRDEPMEWYGPKAGPPIAGAPGKIGAARQPDKFSGSNQLAGIQPGQRGAFGNRRSDGCRIKSGMTKVWKRPIAALTIIVTPDLIRGP